MEQLENADAEQPQSPSHESDEMPVDPYLLLSQDA